jgi:DNA-binding SARP family transcriptional activator/pimeloyl-ACP methyl ester carboxylesterase
VSRVDAALWEHDRVERAGVRPLTEAELRFRVLGAVQLLGPGGPIELAGDKQRALLAALLSRAGAVVAVDRLAEDIWPDERRPSNPVPALQNQVSRLRRALAHAIPDGADLLATVPQGYRLTVSSLAVDAGLFERLLGQAVTQSPAAAIESLEAALALWHGPAYAEFPELGAARLEAIRLEEARTSAVETLGQLLVETGRLSQAEPLLEQFVAEHPLHERGRHALLRALYGLGRQADALARYQEYRHILADELGLEPSAAMRRLEVDILRQDVELPHVSGSEDVAGTPASSLEGMRVRYLNTPPGPIAVGTVGSGRPLVALSGWVSSLDILASGRDPRSSLLQRLARSFTVTMYDRRGTGLSRAASPDSSLDAAVDELESVIEQIGEPVTLVAMSQAGPVALAVAARSPHLVERLVLFGTYADGEATFSNRELRESLVALVRSHHGVGSRLFAEFYRPGASPEAAGHLSRVLRDSADPEVAANYLEATYSADVRRFLPEVTCPALVLHYRNDKVIPFTGGERLAATLPDVRFLPLDGGFHLPDARDLDLIVRAMTEFAGTPKPALAPLVDDGSSA